MMARVWIAVGSLGAALALLVAAQFVHATEGQFAFAAREVFDVANDIHLAHSLALVAVGILCAVYGPKILFQVAGGAFVLGILLFCGGIYAALGQPGSRPYIPIGGLLLMVGWVALAVSVFTFGKQQTST